MYATIYLPMNAQQQAKENRVGPVLVTIGAHVALIAVLAVGLKVVVTKDPFEASKLVEIPITQQIEILDPVAPIPRGQEFFIKPDMPVIPTAPTDTGTGITITPPPIPDGFVDGRAGAGPVVQEPMVNASIVRSFEPPYPSVSRLKDEQGTVKAAREKTTAAKLADGQWWWD